MGEKKNVKKNYKNLNSFYNKLLFSINKINRIIVNLSKIQKNFNIRFF
jgi:hypothetical protein